MDLESFGKKKKKKKRAGIDLADEEADKDAGKLRMEGHLAGFILYEN
jgi:hypothetical protein